MSTLFSSMTKATATLSTATPLPIYAKSMNGGSHPRIFIVGDDVIILGTLDSAL